MVNHLVFYSCRSLGIQQQACFNNSTAHVQFVLRVSLHYICIPLTMARVFFCNYNRKQLEQVGHDHWIDFKSGCPLLVLLSAILSPFQTTGWSDNQMTGHMTSFFSTQFDAPSIGMLINLHV